MKKYFKFTIISLSATLITLVAYAQIYTKDKVKVERALSIAGFYDYPPFGELVRADDPSSFESIFRDTVEAYAKDRNFKLKYAFNNSYDSTVRNVKGGKIDILLGAYYETKQYNGIELVFPSVISNPITVIMLPSRIGEVKTVDDLKNLKGIMHKKEHLSDFVKKEIKNFKLTETDDSNRMFEMLFKGEADYIFTGKYFGTMEAVKLGVKNRIAFSKQVVWNLPIFVGVSKMSLNRKELIQTLQKLFENPETKAKLEAKLLETINDFERKNSGVVPPSYVY